MDFIGVNAALLFSLALRPEYRLIYRVRHAVRPGMAGSRKILLDCDNKMDNHLRFWND